MSLQTAFTEQFQVELPIVCAPMFLVSNEAMVVAASQSGGIGTFPALNYRPIEKYAEAIQNIKKATDKPFGINIIVQESNKLQHQQLDIALEAKVPLIISSLGKPKGLIKKAHAAGTKVYCDVVNLKHAKTVADLGADGLIAVGSGAGGHAGDISPFVLIPHLKQKLHLPVIAAGSIVDGKGMLAAFSLGADAIYMGTRFIASKESPVQAAYKQAIVDSLAENIVNTDRVDGFPGNFIKTPTLETLGLEPSVFEFIFSRSRKVKRWISLLRARKSLLLPEKQKINYHTVFSAGHGVSLIDSIDSISDIMKNTCEEYQQLKASLP